MEFSENGLTAIRQPNDTNSKLRTPEHGNE